MSSTVWFEGLNDEARDQQFGSTTARGKITGSACAARGLKRNKGEGSNSGSGDQLMRTSSSFKWKETFFFFFFNKGGLIHVPAAKRVLCYWGSIRECSLKNTGFKQNLKYRRQRYSKWIFSWGIDSFYQLLCEIGWFVVHLLRDKQLRTRVFVTR